MESDNDLLTPEEANQLRYEAWKELYSDARLTVVKWAEIADQLDNIIDDLTGLRNPMFSDD